MLMMDDDGKDRVQDVPPRFAFLLFFIFLFILVAELRAQSCCSRDEQNNN